MGPSTFYDRFYDAVNYMDVNASYTFWQKGENDVLCRSKQFIEPAASFNYQGTKDRTMQAEYYGVKVNAGFK